MAVAPAEMAPEPTLQKQAQVVSPGIERTSVSALG
jgi:hypothetical protein